MPRLALPPTPAASTDITGKPADPSLAHDPSWSLPPAALAASASERSKSRGSVSSSSVASCNASDSSYHPTSPTNIKKRPSASNGAASAQEDDYSLPPPPTRLRKIIQMKPKCPEDENERASRDAITSKSAGTAKTNANSNSAAGGSGKGKKNGNGSSAAGRKIARKTAHSLIERRRRSKMNEEFGTLKDMIPACAGQEMHKLAILQASIEYMRYLEHCVTELKAAKRSKQSAPDSAVSQSGSDFATPNPTRSEQEDFDDAPSEDENHQDEEMSDISPSQTPNAPFGQPLHTMVGSHSTKTSPSIDPVESGDRPAFSATTSPAIWPTPSIASINGGSRRPSSILTSPGTYGTQGAHQSYVYSTTGHSNAASPNTLPSPGTMAMSREMHHSFSLTSPALDPRPDSREDHEATAALLMLNSDPRNWGGRGSVDAAAKGAVRGEARALMRGKMNVRDLLSG